MRSALFFIPVIGESCFAFWVFCRVPPALPGGTRTGYSKLCGDSRGGRISAVRRGVLLQFLPRGSVFDEDHISQPSRQWANGSSNIELLLRLRRHSGRIG